MNRENKWLVFLALPFVLLISSAVFGQAVQKASFAGYKGVTIGMQMDAARAKLGDAKERSDAEDYYVYGENETLQVLWATDKTVRVLSINYIGKNAPSPAEILGTAAEAKQDGSINKIVRYPKLGYWISYLKTGGDDPMTIITVQKMQPGEQ